MEGDGERLTWGDWEGHRQGFLEVQRCPPGEWGMFGRTGNPTVTW